MSRFREGDGDSNWGFMWHANMERIYRGTRGQKILRELVAALLALPERRLIYGKIGNPRTGEFCALGALAHAKRPDLLEKLGAAIEDDGENDTLRLGQAMGLRWMLAWQIGALNDMECPPPRPRKKSVWMDAFHGFVYVDDGWYPGYTPEQRWEYVYRWACTRIKWKLPMLIDESVR